jgi:hypothetical protein
VTEIDSFGTDEINSDGTDVSVDVRIVLYESEQAALVRTGTKSLGQMNLNKDGSFSYGKSEEGVGLADGGVADEE